MPVSVVDHKINFEHINSNSIIVDAGACRGEFINIVRKTSDCKIFAIEPDTESRKYLTGINFKNVSILGCALIGDEYSSSVEFCSYKKFPERGNIYDRRTIRGKLQKTQSYFVPAICINNIFSILQIDQIDYLKLDVEEAEFDIFSAMTLQTASRIKQFSVEVHPITNHTLEDVEQLVNKAIYLGYKTKWVRKNIELWGIRP